MATRKSVIFYIDGFNLYFSLRQNNWKKYYWLDLEKLASELLRPGHYLKKIRYFTAQVKKPEDKRERQNQFLKAVKNLDFVDIHYGNYQYNILKCFDCGRKISIPKEKKTDVNIASYLIMDVVQNICDVQYILTGDSDLVPPIKLIKEYFPKREIYLVCPPKHVIPHSEFKKNKKKLMHRVSQDLIKLCKGHQYITEKILKKCLLPNPIIDKKGNKIECPHKWK